MVLMKYILMHVHFSFNCTRLLKTGKVRLEKKIGKARIKSADPQEDTPSGSRVYKGEVPIVV